MVRGQLPAVPLAPDGAGGRSRGQRLDDGGRAGRSRGLRRRQRRGRRPHTADRRRGGSPTRCFSPRRTRWRARSYRFHDAARAPRRAVAAPGALAQHQGHLLGLPVVVARRACRSGSCAGALPAMATPDRAVHRVLPLPAGAGVRRARGGGARHRERAQGGDHLHRHVLPAGADHRQHHPRGSIRRCWRPPQTLGARAAHLITKVVVPGIVTEVYTDMRVLLGWAWTYLIVAELIGVSSGITYFINQQAQVPGLRQGVRVDHPDRLIGLGHRHRARVGWGGGCSPGCRRRARAGSRGGRPVARPRAARRGGDAGRRSGEAGDGEGGGGSRGGRARMTPEAEQPSGSRATASRPPRSPRASREAKQRPVILDVRELSKQLRRSGAAGR